MEQATLPTRHGGIGIRRLTGLSIPYIVSSVKSCASLISQITPSSQQAYGLSLVGESVVSFKFETSYQEVSEDDAALRQKKNWTELAARSCRDRIMRSVDQMERACVLTAASPHSGAWICYSGYA